MKLFFMAAAFLALTGIGFLLVSMPGDQMALAALTGVFLALGLFALVYAVLERIE